MQSKQTMYQCVKVCRLVTLSRTTLGTNLYKNYHFRARIIESNKKLHISLVLLCPLFTSKIFFF